MNIFVGSLPYSLGETDLREIFERFGEVSSVKIITDKMSGRSKGFGFIEMPDDDAARKAMEDLNGSDIQGRAIVVNKAEERKDSNRGNFRNDNRSGGFRKDFGRGGNRRDSE